MLLASKAYDVNPTAESVDVLRQALATSELRMTVRPVDGVSQAALTPDGRTMVTVARAGGAVRLWRYPGAASLGALAGVIAAEGQMSVNPWMAGCWWSIAPPVAARVCSPAGRRSCRSGRGSMPQPGAPVGGMS